ncbi:MAG: 2-hydroxyhepta-2,4-diene-1,7-dioate isomerase [Chitinophagia bacterium]|nr:2-hydroxyhepta-2,4-diene-1,7-dioate isomerase [Chitinophagia bacterium]
MKLYRRSERIWILYEGIAYRADRDWDGLVNRPGLYHLLLQEIGSLDIDSDFRTDLPFDAPALGQEIWASGVTYLRSREARMAEAKDAGGGDFYDRVYHAERPEIFFKSTSARATGHLGEVRIRRDSHWNVPEPELTLFVCSEGSIEGYTVGNDMSSRSIEGENPLYLPQAKTYDRSAAIGPCLWVPEAPVSEDTRISLSISRDDATVFSDTIVLSRMKRRPEELVRWLFRELSFPCGCYLMTGTGIVPPDDFTLHAGDTVRITIDGIGTLQNTVTLQ